MIAVYFFNGIFLSTCAYALNLEQPRPFTFLSSRSYLFFLSPSLTLSLLLFPTIRRLIISDRNTKKRCYNSKSRETLNLPYCTWKSTSHLVILWLRDFWFELFWKICDRVLVINNQFSLVFQTFSPQWTRSGWVNHFRQDFLYRFHLLEIRYGHYKGKLR